MANDRTHGRTRAQAWMDALEALAFVLSAAGFLTGVIALAKDEPSLVYWGFGLSGIAYIVGVGLQRVSMTWTIRGHSGMLDQVVAAVRHDVAAVGRTRIGLRVGLPAGNP